MPRCPKGTRKNNATGNCDKGDSKKEKLTEKLQKCITEKNRYKESTAAKDHAKYLKLDQKCWIIENEIENLDSDKHLDEATIDSIIDQYMHQLEPAAKEELREKMRKLTYDKKYRSCFTEKPSINLYHQVVDKLSCYVKYGDKIQ
jgi:superfamily II DNA helicase RecQ